MVVCDQVELSPGASSFNICSYETCESNGWGMEKEGEERTILLDMESREKLILQSQSPCVYPTVQASHGFYCSICSHSYGIHYVHL